MQKFCNIDTNTKVDVSNMVVNNPPELIVVNPALAGSSGKTEMLNQSLTLI